MINLNSDVLIYILSYLRDYTNVIVTNKTIYSQYYLNRSQLVHTTNNPIIDDDIIQLNYTGTEKMERLSPDLVMINICSPSYYYPVTLTSMIRKAILNNSQLRSYSEFPNGLEYIDFGRRVKTKIAMSNTIKKIENLPNGLKYLACHFDNLDIIPLSVTHLVLHGKYEDNLCTKLIKDRDLSDEKFNNIQDLTIYFHVKFFPQNITTLAIHEVVYDILIVPPIITNLRFKDKCQGKIVLHTNINSIEFDIITLSLGRLLYFQNLQPKNITIIVSDFENNTDKYVLMKKYENYIYFTLEKNLSNKNDIYLCSKVQYKLQFNYVSLL